MGNFHVDKSKIKSFPREYQLSRQKNRVRNCTTYISTIVCSRGIESLDILKTSPYTDYSLLTVRYRVNDAEHIEQSLEMKLLYENENFSIHEFDNDRLGKHILVEQYEFNYCIIQKIDWYV